MLFDQKLPCVVAAQSKAETGRQQRHSLSTCHADGAPIAVEGEDAAAMVKLLLVCLVAKSCKVIVGLLVGEEEIDNYTIMVGC